MLTAFFSRRTSIPSFIARFFTGGARWSHCGIYDPERNTIIEALMFRGVVETPFADWLMRYPSQSPWGMGRHHPASLRRQRRGVARNPEQ